MTKDKLTSRKAEIIAERDRLLVESSRIQEALNALFGASQEVQYWLEQLEVVDLLDLLQLVLWV